MCINHASCSCGVHVEIYPFKCSLGDCPLFDRSETVAYNSLALCSGHDQAPRYRRGGGGLRLPRAHSDVGRRPRGRRSSRWHFWMREMLCYKSLSWWWRLCRRAVRREIWWGKLWSSKVSGRLCWYLSRMDTQSPALDALQWWVGDSKNWSCQNHANRSTRWRELIIQPIIDIFQGGGFKVDH